MSEMKKFAYIIVLIFPIISSGEGFLKGIEDIPSFKGMTYVEESLVMFDKVDGRLVSTEIQGQYNYNEVSMFYNRILPNLGWKMHGTNRFIRGNELLELEYKVLGENINVVFNITPKKSE